MTTVKVEYRDNVPHKWIAYAYCRVVFTGTYASKLETEWNKITSERFLTYDNLYKTNLLEIKNLREKAQKLDDELKASKPFWRFWNTLQEKEKLANSIMYTKLANQLEKENDEVKKKRFFGGYEGHYRITNLLKKEGFVLRDASISGDELVTKTEIWVLED